MTNIVEHCNHTSAGVIAGDLGREILLIERMKPPYGYACPAGHLDPGETYEHAASRELQEEVGITKRHLCRTLRFRATQHNTCRRPGGSWHDWRVFTTEIPRPPTNTNPSEVRSKLWANREALDDLAGRTWDYLAGRTSEGDWLNKPGLEPVWLEILIRLGYTTRLSPHCNVVNYPCSSEPIPRGLRREHNAP